MGRQRLGSDDAFDGIEGGFFPICSLGGGVAGDEEIVVFRVRLFRIGAFGDEEVVVFILSPFRLFTFDDNIGRLSEDS